MKQVRRGCNRQHKGYVCWRESEGDGAEVLLALSATPIVAVPLPHFDLPDAENALLKAVPALSFIVRPFAFATVPVFAPTSIEKGSHISFTYLCIIQYPHVRDLIKKVRYRDKYTSRYRTTHLLEIFVPSIRERGVRDDSRAYTFALRFLLHARYNVSLFSLCKSIIHIIRGERSYREWRDEKLVRINT